MNRTLDLGDLGIAEVACSQVEVRRKVASSCAAQSLGMESTPRDQEESLPIPSSAPPHGPGRQHEGRGLPARASGNLAEPRICMLPSPLSLSLSLCTMTFCRGLIPWGSACPKP